MSPQYQAIYRLFLVVLALLTIACGGSGSVGEVAVEGLPVVASVSPTEVSGMEQTMEMMFSHPEGVDKLIMVQLMVAPSLSSQKSCWVEYTPTEKIVRMKDGSGEAKAGEAGSLSNSHCTINAAQVKHTVEGNSLRVWIPVQLARGVVEPQNIFALTSAASQHSGWKTTGTWTPQAAAK